MLTGLWLESNSGNTNCVVLTKIPYNSTISRIAGCLFMSFEKYFSVSEAKIIPEFDL